MRSLVTARSRLGALFAFVVALILLVTSFALARVPGTGEKPRPAVSGPKASAVAVSGAAAGAIAGGGAGGSVTTHEERQAPSMAAPGLTSFGGCKGSVSGGLGVAGFGLALGTTITDEECERLNSAAFLAAQGHGDAAVALVCENRGVAAAMARVGKACPGAKVGPPLALTPAAAAPDHAAALASFCSRHPSDVNCRAAP